MNNIYYNPETNKIVIYNTDIHAVTTPSPSGVALYVNFIYVDLETLGYELIGEF